MSADLETTDEVCASCGKAAVDEVKIKKCVCNLVKYCSVDCQKNHRRSTKRRARREWPKFVTINYLRSQMVAAMENARFAVCLCRLMSRNER
jgi:hypothetical protein